jgi:hypothetical protein
MKNSVVCLVALMIVTLCVPAEGTVVIEPANDFISGNQFGFDLIISDPDGLSAQGFQTTISVDGLGSLSLNEAESQAVDDEPGYWIYGNSVGATVIDLGGDSFQFGDNTDNAAAEPLVEGDIIARYVFAWDGIPAIYDFSIDLNPLVTFVQNEDFDKTAIAFTPGVYEGGDTGFAMLIPEPATFVFLTLGAVLLKRRKA